MRRVALSLLLLAACVAIWAWVASLDSVDDLTLASPGEVVQAFQDDWGLLWDNAWVTLQEVLLGLAIATVAGVAFAIGMHLSQVLRDAAYPLLVGSQAIPIVVLAPILVLAFDHGLGPKLAIVALICFFPVTVNTLDGLRTVDGDAIRMMRTLDASRWQILRRVEAPAALPFAFSGAKIAAVIAPIGAVFAEWSGSSEGLGHMILQANAQYRVDVQLAAVVVLSAIALLLFGLLALAERRVAAWR